MPFQFFEESRRDKWDAFVFSDSINGNFLQSRSFLSYHPSGRFKDASLTYSDKKGNLRAVIPAAEVCDGEKKCFVSHPGSTYGGIVLDERVCSAKRFQELIDELIEFLSENDFYSVDLRFPPDFMWSRDESALVEYMLSFNGFSERTELTTYIDFSVYKEKVLSNFSQGKRTNVNNGIRQGLVCREIEDEREVELFYDMLCENLLKHEASPVHTLEELNRLHFDILKDSAAMLGVFLGDRMLAAGWLFLFKNQGVAHTQYLCADSSQNALSPMTFLYYSAIQYAKQLGCDYLSWGISTEDRGRVLNWGLTDSKEHFGSLHGVHRSYGRVLL